MLDEVSLYDTANPLTRFTCQDASTHVVDICSISPCGLCSFQLIGLMKNQTDVILRFIVHKTNILYLFFEFDTIFKRFTWSILGDDNIFQPNLEYKTA